MPSVNCLFINPPSAHCGLYTQLFPKMQMVLPVSQTGLLKLIKSSQTGSFISPIQKALCTHTS